MTYRFMLGTEAKARNTKGQYKRKPNYIALLAVVLFMGVSTVRAYSAGNNVEIVAGETVTVTCTTPTATPTPTATVIPSAKPAQKQTTTKPTSKVTTASIERHTKAYRGEWTRTLIEYAVNRCGIDNARTLIAVSTAETQQGTRTRFDNNWWNWGMRDYKDVKTAINDVCKGLNGTYKGLVQGGKVNERMARCYVNGCKSKTTPTTWVQNVSWSYSKMEGK